MPKSKAPTVQCQGILVETGERCTRQTRDSSGFCTHHRDSINMETEYALMKCKDCPIDDSCKYSGKGPGELCFFETSDTVKDFDARWKLIQAMRETLRNERMLLNRLSRELSRRSLKYLGEEEDTTFAVMKMHNYVLGLHGVHLEKFGQFMGWKSVKSDDETKAKKDETLQKVFDREMKKKKEEEEAEEEVKKMVTQ